MVFSAIHKLIGHVCKNSNGKKIGAVFLIAVALIVVAFKTVSGSHVYAVYFDDREIGYVLDKDDILEYVEQLHHEESERYGLQVNPLNEVRVVRVKKSAGIQPKEAIVKNQLRDIMEYDVYAYAIIVNGKPTLAVRSIEEYDEVIEELKGAYVSGKDNSVIQAVVLNDQVEARLTQVDPNALYSVDKAAEILRRGTDRQETYLVSRGDSLWTIARNNNMTINEIQQANPQLGNSDRLQPGEKLSLVVADPYVSVSVTEEIVVKEKIPFEVKYQNDSNMYTGATKIITPGKYGYKEVTYLVTKTNGNEVHRETINEVIAENPKAQVVARGTLKAPVAGTGRFLWPVAGGGRITSRYGMRGSRFHAGVDIGASTGTAVLAADSGVVTYAGWAGAYGILVTIDHGNGYVTKYAHNSSVLVSVGQKVTKGSQIARVGSTGNSTGPHLHFEILRNGSTVNPLSFF